MDFNRSKTDYKHGFGILFEEFWLGNDNIHDLTKKGNEMRIKLENKNGEKATYHYKNFSIGDEVSHYQLSSDMVCTQNQAGKEHLFMLYIHQSSR